MSLHTNTPERDGKTKEDHEIWIDEVKNKMSDAVYEYLRGVTGALAVMPRTREEYLEQLVKEYKELYGEEFKEASR